MRAYWKVLAKESSRSELAQVTEAFRLLKRPADTSGDPEHRRALDCPGKFSFFRKQAVRDDEIRHARGKRDGLGSVQLIGRYSLGHCSFPHALHIERHDVASGSCAFFYVADSTAEHGNSGG